MVAHLLRRPSLPRRVRRWLGPWIDRYAHLVGEPAYEVRPAGYVGTVHWPIVDLEHRLQRAGFRWNPLSLLHYTPQGNSADGSWVYRRWPLADRQLHVVLLDQAPSHVDVYAHEEPSWLRHPIAHASETDINRERGARQVRDWFDRAGIDYRRESRLRRRVEHGLNRFLGTATRQP